MSDDYGLYSPAEQWSEQDEWDKRYGELEAIVRDLADEDPCNGDDEYRCALCGDIHGEHDDDCAFVRAARWVSAHPVSGDQP